jgi:aspartate aminotransferase
MIFAKRVLDVPPSATFKYAAMAKKEGVINLTVGRTDFSTPQVIIDAAKKALDEGKVHYTPSKGIPPLREKIAERFTHQNGIKDIDAEKVIVSMGGKQILYEIFMALVDDGDKVAIANPSWVSYDSMIKLAGGETVWLPTKPEKGFVPDEDYMTALEKSKAKILVVNTPSNPTGAVYPEHILREIIDIAERNDMWIVADEVYEKLIFDGAHFSIGSVYPKTITVNAFSKEFSMTGWRLGYACCPDFEVIDKMNIIQGQSVSNPVSFAQWGALACFTPEAEKARDDMVREMEARRDFVMKRMEDFDAVCVKPGGAFYIFPYFEGQDDVELASALLDAGVGTVPGSPFGTGGRSCLRLSFGSANIVDLGKAFDRMKTVKGL